MNKLGKKEDKRLKKAKEVENSDVGDTITREARVILCRYKQVKGCFCSGLIQRLPPWLCGWNEQHVQLF